MKLVTFATALMALALSVIGPVSLALQVPPDRQYQPPDFDLPTGLECNILGSATSIGPSAVTFLCVDGYSPWAAMVVEAGTPMGFDSIVISFDGNNLRIEVTDQQSRAVTILVNKAFADQHLDSSEGNLDIRTSDAVNYEGLQDTVQGVPEGIEGPFYVFIITSFSIRWVEMSEKLPILFIVGGVVAAVVVIGLVILMMKRRR